MLRGLADRPAPGHVVGSLAEGLPRFASAAFVAQAVELSPEGVLGQLGHGQAMGRRRKRHDGVAHFVEQIDRQVKSGAPLRCARARPGRPWTLLPGLSQLVGGIRTPVCVHRCQRSTNDMYDTIDNKGSFI